MRSIANALCLALLGCSGGVDPPRIGLDYGALTEDHEATATHRCNPTVQTEDAVRGTVPLDAARHGVSRQLMDVGARATFDFDVAPVVTDAAATLTLSARARVDDEVCGSGCEGAGAGTRFSWTGTVTLPPFERGYAVRVAFEASRETDRGPRNFQGECAIETPWRAPIVIENGSQTREVDAPPGVAAITLRCTTPERYTFAGLACFGVGNSRPPSQNDLSSWMTASLTVRLSFSPRP
jgi:hypothetical protein